MFSTLRFARTARSSVARRTNRGLTLARPIPRTYPRSRGFLFMGAVTIAAAAFLVQQALAEDKKPAAQAATAPATAPVDYDAVRKAIAAILHNPKHDDGSLGPIFVRLAWHASGTYSKADGSGGSDGGRMRFHPEAGWGANKGLGFARDALEPIKKQFPGISYADLYTLSGVVAIEAMGGPKIPWRPGRVDHTSGATSPPDGRLPDASKGADHIRAIFNRMGFDDQEIVALIGAHTLGRMHKDSSGYVGPWTNAPTTFSNDFFITLVENKWVKKKWDGPEQYEDELTHQLVMTPSDLAFLSDPNFAKFVKLYAADEAVFFADFAKAYGKLLELGVKPAGSAPAAPAPAAAAPAKK